MAAGKTLSCFTDKKLYSKKEFFFPDDVVFASLFIAPFIIALLFAQIYLVTTTIVKKNTFGPAVVILVVGFIMGFYVADLFTAVYHCVFIDDSYRYNQDDIRDGHLIVNTTVGYGSAHHIFPSNWKDIRDSTILMTGLLVFVIPIVLLCFFPNNGIKLFFLFTIAFLILCPFTHKYAHEKLHGRHVPWILDVLFTCGMFLNHKKHQKHHIENNYNWSLLSGVSDSLFDLIVHGICDIFNKCPREDRVYNAQLYKQRFKDDDIIKIQFVGDIEGRLECRLKDNLFIDIE